MYAQGKKNAYLKKQILRKIAIWPHIPSSIEAYIFPSA